jgi:hypothetical protein
MPVVVFAIFVVRATRVIVRVEPYSESLVAMARTLSF